MSFEDLVEARAKRQEKEAAQEIKKLAKEGRERKADDVEANASASQPESKKVVRVAYAPKYTHQGLCCASSADVVGLEEAAHADDVRQDTCSSSSTFRICLTQRLYIRPVERLVASYPFRLLEIESMLAEMHTVLDKIEKGLNMIIVCESNGKSRVQTRCQIRDLGISLCCMFVAFFA